MRTNLIALLLLFSISSFSQNSSLVFVRHDTTILKAAECEWIIKSLAKNDPELINQIGKPVPLIILQSMEKGKLIATDRVTGKQIPAKETYTWQMAADTMSLYDDAGRARDTIMQRRVSSTDFSQIRSFQDWYFDVSTGKFQSEIKWIELLQEVRTSASTFIGNRAYCRIYY
jgi:hypothetical protein